MFCVQWAENGHCQLESVFRTIHPAHFCPHLAWSLQVCVMASSLAVAAYCLSPERRKLVSVTQLRTPEVHWGLCTPSGPLLRRGRPPGCTQRVPQIGFLSSHLWCGLKWGRPWAGWGKVYSPQVLQQGLQPEGNQNSGLTLGVLGGGSLPHPERGMMGISLKVTSGSHLWQDGGNGVCRVTLCS